MVSGGDLGNGMVCRNGMAVACAERTRDTTELVLQQSGVEIGSLDEVVLVGGSTHMPAVFDMLKAVTARPPSRD